ncbi:hypothetical protein V6N13_040782 [Hibiscus sabdariffa]|uniref:Uncharacterized protein n=1 Tax=Hibiscus sabdariffa TaxID=183260 RepID=A0ABR2R9D3_9ROSI
MVCLLQVPANQSAANRFSHDISRMLDNPPKKLCHRRAHSEIITLPNDLNFSDLGVMGSTVTDGPSSDETEEEILYAYLDINKFKSSSQISESSATATPPTDPSAAASTGGGKGIWVEENVPRARHQHSLSMDGCVTCYRSNCRVSVDVLPVIGAIVLHIMLTFS